MVYKNYGYKLTNHITLEMNPTIPKGAHKFEPIGKKRIDEKNNTVECL